MFPRRYYTGRYFAPRYFPQSQGEEAFVPRGPICGALSISVNSSGTLSIAQSVSGTIATSVSVTGTLEIERC